MKRRKAFAREERLIQIVAVFVEALYREQHDMTIAEVARALELTPSTKLRAMVEHLVKQNALVSRTEVDTGIAGFRRLYSLHHDYVVYDPKTYRAGYSEPVRTIKVNSAQGSFLEVMS